MNDIGRPEKIRFDEFELDAERRLLLRNGEVVALNGKAVDLFTVLVRNRGRLVTKDELLETVWTGQFVEENNLTVQIAALRKALGEKKGENRYIVTVPGKGYEFVGELNGNLGEEIIVESREIKRIVIDEHTSDDPTATRGARVLSGKSRQWAFGLIVAVVAVSATAFIFTRSQGTTLDRSTRFTSRIFPVTGGIPQRVAISPDGKTLAYSRRSKGKDSIWLGDLEKQASIQLTEDSYRLHDALELSPDGRTVYFTAKDESHPTYTLMKVSTFGGAVVDLVSGVAGGIAVSTDGSRIAYFKVNPETGRNSLYVMDAGTGQETAPLLSPEAPQKFRSNRIAWSPTEDRVTVALSDEDGAGCDFTNIDPENGATVKTGKETCGGVVNFAWLRDGTGLLTTQASESGGDKSDIFVVDFRTGTRNRISNEADSYVSRSLSTASTGQAALLDIRNLTNIVSAPADDPGAATVLLQGTVRAEGIQGVASAPDGKILFTVLIGNSRGIWQMNSDGAEPRELIAANQKTEDSQVHVTADNRYLIFDSDRGGTSEIWRSNRDGSSLKQLTSGGGNSLATISPDGLSMVYSRSIDGKIGIWRMPIEGGPPEELVRENCSWPAVSPDGEYIACATGTEAGGEVRQIAVYPLRGGVAEPKLFPVAVSAALYNRLRWSADSNSILYKDIVEGLWQQRLSGGKPERLAGFDGVRVFHFTHTLEGRLLYSGGTQMRQIVILNPAAN